MAVIRTVLSDADLVARAGVPRDDIVVREHAVGPRRFVGEGPFTRWERVIDETTDGGSTSTVQVLEYSVAAPLWGRLADVALRRVIGQPPGGRRWWTPPVRLSRRDSEVLARCATLAVIAGFLGGLVSQTITYASSEFGTTSSAQAGALAVIRVGALVTLFSLAAADRWGRRRLIHLSLLSASIAAFVTAFAPNLTALTAAQLVCRGSVAAAALLIAVVCAEEMPAAARAFGIGITALAGGLGVGMVLWCLPVVDVGVGAWRLIYLLALPFGVVAGVTARRLPETARFDALTTAVRTAVRTGSRVDGRRLAAVGTTFFLLNCFAGPTSQLQNDYLRVARGLSGTQIAVFLLLTNTWGGLGVWGAARFSDRVSRRFTALVGLVGFAVGNAVMFSVGGVAMWVASLAGSVIGAAMIPSLGALQPELFPTRRRALSSGWTNIAAVSGSVFGLMVTGRIIDTEAATGYGTAIPLLAMAPLLAAILMIWIPETAGRDLESINPDDREQ